MSLAIEAEGLVKRYDNGKVTALDGVDIAVRAGTVLGVLGPNGAGKTTAVRILASLVRPDSGTARVQGIDVIKHADQVRRRIGLTGQYASVDDALTGTENLVLIGRLLDLTRSEAKARAKELLADFDLTDAGERAAKTYSGGMRRRLDLAAGLVGRPSVVFLDEPTTGLDPAKREEVWSMVRGQVAQGVTVLLTTQYLEEADALADEISVFDHGRVISQGTPDELKQRLGGQTLEVRFADLSRTDEVSALLASVSAKEVETARPGVLSVPVDDDRAMTRVVRELDEAGISVTELALRLPSLDEVFFSLTGRHDIDDEEGAA